MLSAPRIGSAVDVTIIVIAYREVFPRARNLFQTEFDSRSELVRSVCHSSMFALYNQFTFPLRHVAGLSSPAPGWLFQGSEGTLRLPRLCGSQY